MNLEEEDWEFVASALDQACDYPIQLSPSVDEDDAEDIEEAVQEFHQNWKRALKTFRDRSGGGS